jgi:PAS domain S-box-containing protein
MNGTVSHVNLIVEPVPEFQSVNLYTILFENLSSGVASEHGEARATHVDSDEIIRDLESELRSAQEHAQAMYEELESSNEELRSANEEFQSTNEELETSKEELQSFNEELETVNSELNRKVSELDHANGDLQNLLNSAQVATIFLSTELRIKNFTPAAASAFRLISGDIGRPITDLAELLTGGDLLSDINEILRTLTVCERQLTGTAGQHFQMRILPYRTVHNVIDGVVLTFVDVTQLKEAEEFARSIVDTVREPLLVLDGNLRVNAASKSFYETFQVSETETMKRVLYDLGNKQWDIPDLRQLLGEVLRDTKTIEDFKVKDDFPGIGPRTMLLNARRIERQSGKEPLILLAIEDVSERECLQESQSQLSAIVESSDDAIISSDLDGIIRSWNRGAEELFGYRAKEIIGKPLSILAARKNTDEIPNVLARLGRGERVEHYESERRAKDGRSIPVSLSVSSIVDSSGRVIGASKIVRDITEQKRSEEALRSLNLDLQHFAYAASHDLQEPLRMVMSYTQLLARQYKGKLDQHADQYIGYAVQGAERMETLLRDLREYWSVNEQKLNEPVPVECEHVLAKALDLLAAPVRESGGLVTHDPLPTIVAEETPLVLLFQNLIGNALKYHRPDEPPRIHVSAERSKSVWIFAVRDNGIGIEAEHAEKIFAPFKRLHGAEFAGSGIGLAICQRVVERYGGRVWVESEYGQGSTFRFTLPANEVKS